MNDPTQAYRLSEALRQLQLRIVFAESCTAGMVSALLAAIPGISGFLCGSMVTYREDSKQRWLSVPEAMLREHTAVSPEVTRQMAMEVLRRTPEADLGVAVTGHLGPHVEPELDGRGYVAVARRTDDDLRIVHQSGFRLTQSQRVERQLEAARYVLSCATDAVQR